MEIKLFEDTITQWITKLGMSHNHTIAIIELTPQGQNNVM